MPDQPYNPLPTPGISATASGGTRSPVNPAAGTSHWPHEPMRLNDLKTSKDIKRYHKKTSKHMKSSREWDCKRSSVLVLLILVPCPLTLFRILA